MKKVLSVLLCFVFCLSVISGCASKNSENVSPTDEESKQEESIEEETEAKETEPPRPEINIEPRSGKCGTNITYTLSSDGTLTFTPTGEEPEFEEYDLIETENDWDIPNAPWVDMRDYIYEVIFEEGIDHVPDRYFCDYNMLAKITLGSVESIGEHSFKSCEALCEIVIPETVMTIGDGAFTACPKLRQVTLPERMSRIGIDAFYGCPIESVDIPFGLEDLCSGCFCFYSTVLEKVVIPDSVKKIRSSAFAGVKEVIISPSVEIIEDDAFNTENLERIYVPDSVTTIEDGAIGGENVTIYGAKGSRAQAYAEANDIPFKVEAMKYGEIMEYKPDYDLGTVTDSGTFISEVEYSGNIHWEYYGDTKTLVIFGEGMMSTVSGREYPWDKYRDEVNALYIKPGLTKLGENSFSSMSNLTELYLPSTLVEINTKVFYSCGSLKELRIPEGVCAIYEDAFSSCDGLERVYLPTTLVKAEHHAFNHTSAFEVYYPGTEEMYRKWEIRDFHLSYNTGTVHFAEGVE